MAQDDEPHHDAARALPPQDRRRGLVAGGRGGPEDELLESGQEEVFARGEVESGRIEHHAEAGGLSVDVGGDADRHR